jgi:hypothetical protein
LYTLTNYLSYQGNDLARSLLLFDSNEILDNKGTEVLKIHLSNLAGYDKQSWNSRLIKSEEIINNITTSTFTRILELSEGLSEPLQFISTALAHLEIYKNNIKNIPAASPPPGGGGGGG